MIVCILIPGVLFYFIGWSGIIGIGIIVTISLIQAYGTKFNTKLRLKIGDFADHRV